MKIGDNLNRFIHTTLIFSVISALGINSFCQSSSDTNSGTIRMVGFFIGASRPSAKFKDYSFSGGNWNFKKNVYYPSLDFFYLLEFPLNRKISILSLPRKYPILKTGFIINSRSGKIEDIVLASKGRYSQNQLIIPLGILNCYRIKNKPIFFESGLGLYTSFLLTESVKLFNPSSENFKLAFLKQASLGIYIEAGISNISMGKKRHSFGLRVSNEFSGEIYRGRTKYPFDMRSLNFGIYYSLFEFIK